MAKPLETTWVGLQVVWDRVSGNHQHGTNSISQVLETQIGHQPAVSVEGGLNEGIMASASTSVWEKAAPPVFGLSLA